MRALILIGLLLVAPACTDDRAREMFETAQFEERQHNFEHAKELYNQILREYGRTTYAAEAQSRLRDLEGIPTTHPDPSRDPARSDGATRPVEPAH